MPVDLLVKLYDLDLDWSFIQEQEARGILIRKPIGPERNMVEEWVRLNFGEAWASETSLALSNVPKSIFIAIQEKELIGFGCYDATVLGNFGPTGVIEHRRGQGTGRALLLACLLDMKLKGYGHAVIGGAGPVDFYKKVLNVYEIPDSWPGLWKTWVRTDED